MVIPGRRVIGQYLWVEEIDDFISTHLSDAEWAKAFFDLLNDPVMVTDGEGNIIMANEAFIKMRGITKAELLGCNVRNFSPPSKICEVLRTKKAVFGLSQRQDGRQYMVEIRPVMRDDTLLGTIMMAKDISVIDRVGYTEPSDLEPDESLHRFDSIVGESRLMAQLKAKASVIATTDLPVLITGETGTGKDLLARAIHEISPRSGGAFVAVNCSAFPEGLIDSELFGYEDGSFTGSRRGGKAGLIESADGGTLFLDEIGDMPLEFQPRLLRVIEDGVLRRVGSVTERRLNIRLIAATNRSIEDLCRQGKFRSDLFYRLSVAELQVPPLRDRKEDIPSLIAHFTSEFREKAGRTVTVSPCALAVLQSYAWPGNVRELRSVVLSSAYQCRAGMIRKIDLPARIVARISAAGFLSRRSLLLSYLREHRMITNREYCKLTNVDRTTAFRDLSQLVDQRVLRASGQGRSRAYSLAD